MKKKDNNPFAPGALALFTLLALSVSSTPARAAESDAGDPDSLIQGEYSGTVDGQKAGIQIVALGDGSFEGILFPGGLPGDGWDGNRETLRKAPGQRNDDGSATFTKEGATAIVREGKITLAENGEDGGSMERVVRESPTLGAKAPEGAIVLFDGSGLEAWQDGARMTDDKLLMEGANTKEKFVNITRNLVEGRVSVIQAVYRKTV